MNASRRDFICQLAGVGLFTILPGAGRLWRVERPLVKPTPPFVFCDLDGRPLPFPLQEIMQRIFVLQRQRLREFKKATL
jgi:hypothetical protein